MKIKMRHAYAGPRGTFPPGSVIDVPDVEAAQLIAGHYADKAAKDAPETAQKPRGERATARTAQPRTASAPQPHQPGGAKAAAAEDKKA